MGSSEGFGPTYRSEWTFYQGSTDQTRNNFRDPEPTRTRTAEKFRNLGPNRTLTEKNLKIWDRTRTKKILKISDRFWGSVDPCALWDINWTISMTQSGRSWIRKLDVAKMEISKTANWTIFFNQGKRYDKTNVFISRGSKIPVFPSDKNYCPAHLLTVYFRVTAYFKGPLFSLFSKAHFRPGHKNDYSMRSNLFMKGHEGS